MSDLIIQEHASSWYKPRTIHNAKKADITLAFAFDFNTAGENLTKNSAGREKYCAIPLFSHNINVWVKTAYEFIHAADHCKGREITINIAGNGSYTLKQYGWAQVNINRAVYFTLLYLERCGVRIKKIVSGGQTGADLAGAVAGLGLRLDVEVTMPKGFRYRGADGIDYSSTREVIETMINNSLVDLI